MGGVGGGVGIARVESPSDSCSLLLKCMRVGSEDKEEELRAGCVESYEHPLVVPPPPPPPPPFPFQDFTRVVPTSLKAGC